MQLPSVEHVEFWLGGAASSVVRFLWGIAQKRCAKHIEDLIFRK